MAANLHDLLIALMRAKPAGWSVVKRGNQIQIRPRPAERRLCKFVVRRNVTTTATLTVGCYDGRANAWDQWIECPPEPAVVFQHLCTYLDGLRQLQ